MSYYPDTLKAILVYIEALDAADKKVLEVGSDGLPYLEKITLMESEGGHFGWLVDEIGGSWSWVPASTMVPLRSELGGDEDGGGGSENSQGDQREQSRSFDRSNLSGDEGGASGQGELATERSDNKADSSGDEG